VFGRVVNKAPCRRDSGHGAGRRSIFNVSAAIQHAVATIETCNTTDPSPNADVLNVLKNSTAGAEAGREFGA
jgi:hypothetical protein